ncbi:nucleoside 2-deoxyribosyltransferase domain protein [Leptospira weilii str. 2006001853]|uniref:Nucleoside 2-deoxyribosyltransferase domain protein n=1 Tax=Leptospira weilii str. 2006001853 TaxID=1001589 RepID=A0A828YVX0_9LEPT|nr:nucleoside 2-deoxyribosyltransferase [Leptospira weilii]EKR62374.1 nucleoside 2-deoxyribosyltransferase domain protein [Leptospira weilii str. 2006001853]EMN42666.1 nucleoside 2-deoxyribosyltransferase domain protein [Leptospira weilii str. LNT 1234]
MIQRVDIVLANCNSLRGALVDDGTSVEIGTGFSIGKRIYGYTKTILPLPEIVRTKIPVFPHNSGYPIDKDGYLLSDFGNCPNPMLD